MPFRKQSDDPWNRKPDKPPAKPRESQEGFVENLKTWNEQRKAAAREAAKEKEEAQRLPPEKCPWCGKDMEQGYLASGRGTTKWYPGHLTAKAAWIGRWDAQALYVLDEDNFIPYKTTWLCRDCKKMVFNAPDLESGSAASSQSDETREEEESED